MTQFAFQEILYEKDEASGIVTITLNTPQRKNALSVRTFLELYRAVDAMEKDDDTRGMLLTGATDPQNADPAKQAFSSGGFFDAKTGALGKDDSSLTEEEKEEIDFTDIAQKRMTLKLWQFDKPVVAALNGYAIGGGFTMPLAGADLIFASEHAWAWLPFVPLGIVPEFASTFLLPRMLGFQKAKEILLLGEKIPARRLLDLGLVNYVVPHDELISRSRQALLRLIPPQGASLAVQKTKRAMHKPLVEALKRALEQENRGLNEAFQSADFLEALTARFERRKPHFQGR